MVMKDVDNTGVVPVFGSLSECQFVMSRSAIGDLEFMATEVRAEDGFDDFYRAQLRPLIGLAYVLSGSSSAAEDIAQDALAVASKRWSEIRQMENPSAWVRRIVANRSVSIVRRRIIEAKGLVRLGTRSDDFSSVPELPSDSEHVWALVRKLPRRQAQVITLRALDKSTVGEIAEVLGMSEATTSTHLRRARHTLATQLTPGDVR